MLMNILEHLLEVEAEAAVLVSDAQEEADKRIRENEEKNRASYEERKKTEMLLRESKLKDKLDIIKNNYLKELDDYRKEILSIKVDEHKFSILLDEYFTKG